jgi:hypothetical protein
MPEQPKTPLWGNVTPTYSNFFVVAATPAILRITFGEAFGSPDTAVFHTAIALSPQDAEALIIALI